jgi:hypothetical protein
VCTCLVDARRHGYRLVRVLTRTVAKHLEDRGLAIRVDRPNAAYAANPYCPHHELLAGIIIRTTDENPTAHAGPAARTRASACARVRAWVRWRVLCAQLKKKSTRAYGDMGVPWCCKYEWQFAASGCVGVPRPSATCVSCVGLRLRSVGPTGSPFRERGAYPNSASQGDDLDCANE